MTAARITALAVFGLSITLFSVGAMAERQNRTRFILQEDARLTIRAADALRANPVLNLQPIEAEAYGDMVVLRGAAVSPAIRDAAVKAVRRVPGVREIRDEIRVPAGKRPAVDVF